MTRTLGLWLTLAFLLVLNPYFAGKALAQPDMQAGFTSGKSPTIVGGKVHIPLTVTPLTEPVTGTIQIQVFFMRSGAKIAGGTKTIGNQVYADLKALTEVVYDGVPAGYGPYGVGYGAGSAVTVAGSTVSVVVYLDELAAPTPPDEGGGAVIPGPGTVTSGTSTGWQTYQPSTGTSTVYVDPEKTEGLYQAAPPTGVVLVSPPTTPTGEIPPNVTASLPLTTVQQGGDATVPSVLNMGNVDISLPPEIMHALADQVLAGAGALGSLQVRVSSSTQETTEETLGGLGADDTKGKNAASQVITVSFVLVDAQGKETVLTVDKSLVSVTFNRDAVEDPEKVNLYIIGSLIYVGGKVDLANNKVTAEVSGLKDARLIALEYMKTFADISGHWAQGDIELMASKYVIQGMTEDEYMPQNLVTRAQFVTLLVRSLELPEVKPAAATFSDVASGAWYYGCIEAAYKAGLANGDGGKGGAFRPDASISREEMAALLTRAMKVYGSPAGAVEGTAVSDLLTRFKDSSSVSDWAKVEVAQSVNEGLIKGRDDGGFDPVGNGTRAEAATMMSRLVRKLGII